ncbi:MAG: hypothetical protein NC328_06755 [Muribaculum sp.]|nr:hypothetical protein [Muribaculum sp.]
MNHKSLSLLLAVSAVLPAVADVESTDIVSDNVMIPIFDKVVFYDGYRSEIVDKDLSDGVLRHSNSIYARRLTDNELDHIGDNLRIDLIVGALCDNYDRIGDINIALVPKGSDSYIYKEVERLQVARFITPFMNKNRMPDSVPYSYDVADLPLILRNSSLRGKYDFWVELELFGVPYAANTQILGCADRNDVFSGTLSFTSAPFTAQTLADASFVVPIYTKQTEEMGDINFNSYNPLACDEVGKAERTFCFNVPADATDSQLVLIMTNHGANAGGEEYIRRVHFVYVDDELQLTYTPGGENCNVYREYNTQPNGIYGASWNGTYTTDEEWEEFSNWCPGGPVPIRRIHLGALSAGEHKVKISVPDAQFVDNQGDFRPSLYLQGLTEGSLPEAAVDAIAADKACIQWTINGQTLSFTSADPLLELNVYALDGALLFGKNNPSSSIDLSPWKGMSLVVVAIDRQGRSDSIKVQL